MKASTEFFSQGVSSASLGRMETRDLQSIVALTLERSRERVGYNHDIAFAVLSDEEAASQELHPEESRLWSVRTHIKRISRWRRGRAAAHSALRRLGIDDCVAITQGAAGEPVWPNGISGSITHCNEYSIAAVLRSFGCFFLGIDLEDLQHIQNVEIESVVCRPNERTLIADSADPFARLGGLFSAKEALYKALFPSHRRYIDFTEVELSLSSDKSGFHAEMPSSEHHVNEKLSFISTQRYKNLIFSCSIHRIAS